MVNSLGPGKYKCNLKLVILKGISRIDIESIPMSLRWMPQNLINEKRTSVQAVAWCCQVASRYLSQCWPRSMSPYGITMLQSVNKLWWEENGQHFADDIFKYLLLKRKLILIQMSVNFVPDGLIDNSILVLIHSESHHLPNHYWRCCRL